MYVRVCSNISGLCYQSMVYATINSGWFLQCIVLNPHTNYFELIDYFDKTSEPAKPLVHIIQTDTSGFRNDSGTALYKFKYFCKNNNYDPMQLTCLCGYPDVCEDYDFLFRILKHRKVPVNQCKIQVRQLPDVGEWNYINTQQDADCFMDLFAGFHDATLESLVYTESQAGTKEVKAVFDNSGWFGIVELCFEGVELLKIVPTTENYTRELFAATLWAGDEGVFWADDYLEQPNDAYSGSIIKAFSLKWRKKA